MILFHLKLICNDLKITSDNEDKDKKVSKSTGLGHFAHLAEYIKLYDVLKNAHTNFKMSLDDSTEEKLCGLLRTTLISLGRLLEVTSMLEFGPLAEELLIYLKSVTSLEATNTVFCGQQVRIDIYNLICQIIICS